MGVLTIHPADGDTDDEVDEEAEAEKQRRLAAYAEKKVCEKYM